MRGLFMVHRPVARGIRVEVPAPAPFWLTPIQGEDYCGVPGRREIYIEVMPQVPPDAPVSRKGILRRFAQLSRAFLFGENRRNARILVGLLIGLSLAVGGVSVLMNFAGGAFVTSLAQRDSAGFY